MWERKLEGEVAGYSLQKAGGRYLTGVVQFKEHATSKMTRARGQDELLARSHFTV